MDAPFTLEQRVALMRMGFSVRVDVNSGRPDGLVRGVHRVVIHYDLCDDQWVYKPWTTYWNPDIEFTDPVAAVAWAEVAGWGEEFRGRRLELSAEFKAAFKNSFGG